MKKLLSMLLCVAMAFSLVACGKQELPSATTPAPEPAPEIPVWDDAVTIELSDEKIRVTEGHISAWTELPLIGDDYAGMHNDKVMITNDIVYYEDGHDFTYGEGEEGDAHCAEEAAAHTVVTITQPGAYILKGKLSAGQIAVDLGEDAKDDPDAVVDLYLDGVDITCTVAPAIIFYNVYECGDKDNPTKDVDTTAAGANVWLMDFSENFVNGSYVARIYKPESVVLNEDGTEVEEAKKLHKYDGAFYSKMSMNIGTPEGGNGSGILRIDAENEGLDSEMHLTINGGYIFIQSGNDGINTNEDGVSVTTINDGDVFIMVTGETGEGDGIDSNGWLVINGGTVEAIACSNSADAGIDSDMGIHIGAGANVIATGHMLDRIESADQTYVVFRFSQTQSGKEWLKLRSANGTDVLTVAPQNDYSVLLYSGNGYKEGDYTLWSGDTQLGHSGAQGGIGGRPGDMQPPEGFNPETMQPPVWNDGFMPERGERPEMPEGFDPANLPNMPVDMPQHGGRPGGNRNPGTPTATEEFFTISYGKENQFYGVGELMPQ